MLIIYTPEGGERQEWAFTPAKLRSTEAEVIERHTGWTYQEFGEKFMAGSAQARHALLFVLLRRSNPTLKYGDVVFSLDELDVDLDAEEKARALEVLRAQGNDLSDEQREALEVLVLDEMAAAAAGAADPKGSDPASS